MSQQRTSQDSISGRPPKDAAFESLDYGRVATSCDGELRAKILDACDVTGQDLVINQNAFINNLEVNNLTVNNFLDLDCETSSCFLVDNRNINYCTPPFQTIQAGIDAACASGLAKAVVCIAPSTYTENVLIPETCATQLLITSTEAGNSNEARVAEVLARGHWVIRRPTVIQGLTIEGLGTPAIDLCPVRAITATEVPYLAILDSELRSTGLTGTNATLNCGHACGGLTLVANATVRVDNTRIRAPATNSRIVNVSADTGFISTADSNMHTGEFWNNSTRVSAENGVLLVNSSFSAGATLHQNSTTLNIRLQDVRLSSLTNQPITFEVDGAENVTFVTGFIRTVTTTYAGLGGGVTVPGTLRLMNVSQYEATTPSVPYFPTVFRPEIDSGFTYIPVLSTPLGGGNLGITIPASGLATSVTREGEIFTISGSITGITLTLTSTDPQPPGNPVITPSPLPGPFPQAISANLSTVPVNGGTASFEIALPPQIPGTPTSAGGTIVLTEPGNPPVGFVHAVGRVGLGVVPGTMLILLSLQGPTAGFGPTLVTASFSMHVVR